MDKQELIDTLNQQSKTHYDRWRSMPAGTIEGAIELALADAFESLAEGLKS